MADTIQPARPASEPSIRRTRVASQSCSRMSTRVPIGTQKARPCRMTSFQPTVSFAMADLERSSRAFWSTARGMRSKPGTSMRASLPTRGRSGTGVGVTRACRTTQIVAVGARGRNVAVGVGIAAAVAWADASRCVTPSGSNVWMATPASHATNKRPKAPTVTRFHGIRPRAYGCRVESWLSSDVEIGLSACR